MKDPSIGISFLHRIKNVLFPASDNRYFIFQKTFTS